MDFNGSAPNVQYEILFPSYETSIARGGFVAGDASGIMPCGPASSGVGRATGAKGLATVSSTLRVGHASRRHLRTGTSWLGRRDACPTLRPAWSEGTARAKVAAATPGAVVWL